MSKYLIFSLILIFGISCQMSPSKFETNLPKESITEKSEENTAIKDATVISVNKDKTILLNGEKIGTIDETSNLEKELLRIFEAKKKSNDKNATAVFVKAGRDMKNDDLAKLIDKLKKIGAAPIGLQMDDFTGN